MSFDPHFKKTVLAAHFDGIEDENAASRSLRTRAVRARQCSRALRPELVRRGMHTSMLGSRVMLAPIRTCARA